MAKAMRQNLFLDAAVISRNHDGEKICGDFFGQYGSLEHPVFVLSDGMGSGVKANIMSTITVTILGRLLEHGIPLAECVDTIAASLPLCKERGIAYSTFTAAELRGDQLFVVEYGNPTAILFRGGQPVPSRVHVRFVGDKEIHERTIPVQSGDVLLMMSDGVTHAGIGVSTIDGWREQDIASFLAGEALTRDCAAVTAARLDAECSRMSAGQLGDDRTICVLRFCPHATTNVAIGPPAKKHNADALLHLFFSKKGKHIVCGGSTSQMVSDYLQKPLALIQGSGNAEVPDMARIDGVDLVTEGIITIGKLIELRTRIESEPTQVLALGTLPHEQLYRALFMDSTNVNIFFGTASNEGHDGTRINFENKLSTVKRLCELLQSAGKMTQIQYY